MRVDVVEKAAGNVYLVVKISVYPGIRKKWEIDMKKLEELGIAVPVKEV